MECALQKSPKKKKVKKKYDIEVQLKNQNNESSIKGTSKLQKEIKKSDTDSESIQALNNYVTEVQLEDLKNESPTKGISKIKKKIKNSDTNSGSAHISKFNMDSIQVAKNVDVDVLEKNFLKLYPDVESLSMCQEHEDIQSVIVVTEIEAARLLKCTTTTLHIAYEKFLKVISESYDHSLVDILHTFKVSREKSNKLFSDIKYLKSSLRREKNLWENVTKSYYSQGKCQDCLAIDVSYPYEIKCLDLEAFNSLKGQLKQLNESIIDYVFCSYTNQLNYVKVEQLIQQFCSGEMKISAVKEEHISTLRQCISILFHYQRQSVKDKKFYLSCQEWTKTLVLELLHLSSQAGDNIFIANHVVRSPNGIDSWASKMVQVPFCDGKEECVCLYNFLIIVRLIIEPVPQKDAFLRNLKTSVGITDAKFLIVDSEGEEEEDFEMYQDWSDEDWASLLNQIPLDHMYTHLLSIKKTKLLESKRSRGTSVIIFAFSNALVQILVNGLMRSEISKYPSSVELICVTLRKIVNYVTEFWKQYKVLNLKDSDSIQALYEKFILSVLFSVHKCAFSGAWKFICKFPFNYLSSKILWNVLWIFHFCDSFEIVYETRDIDKKFIDCSTISILVEEMKKQPVDNQIYFIKIYKSIALHGKCEKQMLQLIIKEIFHITFFESMNYIVKEGSIAIKCIIEKDPSLLTDLLKEIDFKSENEEVFMFLKLFDDLSLLEWIPAEQDFALLHNWLLEHELSSPKNKLTRILFSKLNYGFSSEGKLILSLDFHRKVAVSLVQAYVKFDEQANSWSMSRGIKQIIDFLSLSHNNEDSGFTSWSWNIIFSLKLHKLDMKDILWANIFDQHMDLSDIPNPNDSKLVPLLNAYNSGNPMAQFVYIVMTTEGHHLKPIQATSIPCFCSFIEQKQYLSAIQLLYYTVPFFVKCEEKLLNNDNFMFFMNELIMADSNSWFKNDEIIIGVVLKKLSAMINNQVHQAWKQTEEFSLPVIKTWLKLLFNLLNLNKSIKSNWKFSMPQIYFLQNTVLELCIPSIYLREYMLEFVQNLINDCLQFEKTHQVTEWYHFKNKKTISITMVLDEKSLNTSWLKFFVLWSKAQEEETILLWNTVQKEMYKDNFNLDEVLQISYKHIHKQTRHTESLPIYFYCKSILNSKIEDIVLPLLFQQFFTYYFERNAHDGHLGNSIGYRYFSKSKGIQTFLELRSIINKAIGYYANVINKLKESTIGEKIDLHPHKKNVSSEVEFYSSLLNMFQTYSQWVQDDTLHSKETNIAELGPIYDPKRFSLIIKNVKDPWFELIRMQKYDDSNTYNPVETTAIEETTVQISKSNKDYYSLDDVNFDSECNMPPIKPSDICNSLDASVADFTLDFLKTVVEQNQSAIFHILRSFEKQMEKLYQMNISLISLVPMEYENVDIEISFKKPCFRGENRCTGPAKFNFQVQKCVKNKLISGKIAKNRTEFSIELDNILQLDIKKLCEATISIENLVRILILKVNKSSSFDIAENYRNMGIDLFFHQMKEIDTFLSDLSVFAISTQLFSSSFEILGMEFILNNECQLLNLVESILKYPEAGKLVFHLFDPSKACIPIFIDVYKQITSSVTESSVDSIYVLLSKIDFTSFLKVKNLKSQDRQYLFDSTWSALLKFGSTCQEELQKVSDILLKNFKTLVEWCFPELYCGTIKVLLKGTEESQVPPDVWYILFDCLGCPGLNQQSEFLDIHSVLRTYVRNIQLPSAQQIFVSLQPVDLSKIQESLTIMQHLFGCNRNNVVLYEKYNLYVKPIGIFLAILINTLRTSIAEDTNHKSFSTAPDKSFFHDSCITIVWKYLNLSFIPWLYPIRELNKICFPFMKEHTETTAKFMFQIYTMIIKEIHDQFSVLRVRKTILSFVFQKYVEVYVEDDIRHHLIIVCHTELLNLPWHEFHLKVEDIDSMCTILKTGDIKKKEFLYEICSRIPWIEALKKVSSEEDTNVVGKTLESFLYLLFLSKEKPLSLYEEVKRNNLKSLDCLPWQLIDVSFVEDILKKFYQTCDIKNLVAENNKVEGGIFELLNYVCFYTPLFDHIDQVPTNDKSLCFFKEYFKFVIKYINENPNAFKNGEVIENALLHSLQDIKKVLGKGILSKHHCSFIKPLLKTLFVFCNDLMERKCDDINLQNSMKDFKTRIINILIKWIAENPGSVILLICLQTAGECIKKYEFSVEIMECCISTYLITSDSVDPSNMLNQIHSNFKISMPLDTGNQAAYGVLSSGAEGFFNPFINACDKNSAFFCLYLNVISRMKGSNSIENISSIPSDILKWIEKIKLKTNEEAKCLLLWDIFFQTSSWNSQVLILFCEVLEMKYLKKGWFHGVKKMLSWSLDASVNFTFLCQVMVAFIKNKISSSGKKEKKVTEDTECQATNLNDTQLDAQKSIDDLIFLMKNKSYSALIELTNNAVEVIKNPEYLLKDSQQVLKRFAVAVFCCDRCVYLICHENNIT